MDWVEDVILPDYFRVLGYYKFCFEAHGCQCVSSAIRIGLPLAVD